MDMDFFDVSFEESLDEQLVNAILDVGRDIRRLFEGKESQSRILMILRLHGAVTQKMLIQILHIQPGSARRDSEEDGKGWLNYQGTERNESTSIGYCADTTGQKCIGETD